MTIKEQVASINIKLSQIVPSKTNPRKHFGDDMLKEMAASIEAHGILQPILVRSPREGKYEIVAGETRWRAACMTNLEEAPCLVRDLSDFEALEIQVLENLHRNDLTPMEEAQGFRQLLDKSHDIAPYTIDQLADKIGKSRTYVYDSLKLLDLPDQAVDALNSGMLNRSTALMVARLDDRVQTSALKNLLKGADEGVSVPVRQAKKMIDREIKESACMQEADGMIARLHLDGLTVVDLRDEGACEEWAHYGIYSADWKHKEGFCSARTSLLVPDGLETRRAGDYITEDDASIATHLVGIRYDEVLCVPLYPSDIIEQRHQAALDAGLIPQRTVVLSEYDIKRQKRAEETARRVEYVTRLIAAIDSQPEPPQALHIACKLMLDLVLKNGHWNDAGFDLLQPLGVADGDALLNMRISPRIARLALAFYVSQTTDAPWDDDDEDDEWFEVKKIATLYGLPLPETAKQPDTPLAAAQAQDQDAPEENPDPAAEVAGELSEDEARLATAEPAAQAEEQAPAAERTAAQKRMDEIKEKTLARKARKESARADQSKTAPAASASGETTRSEVAA